MIFMKPKVYIDGKEGTTGLQIYQRLGERDDIELLLIDEALRKDVNERKKLINSADIVFLCLPDDAAIEAVSLAEKDSVRIIDASTAHRTHPDWVYGLPELSPSRRQEIAKANRVANPGCHATGFISIVYPLVQRGIMPKDYPVTCFSLTGYSGGGKKKINQYENEKTPDMYAPQIYGLNLKHKHLPEMMAVTGLEKRPVFSPIIDDYYKGMAVSVPLHNNMLSGKNTAESIRSFFEEYYSNEYFISVAPQLGDGTLESNFNIGTNFLEITVSGDDELTLVTARFDNLGKGASGAAVQNMNIMLGFDEKTGL